VPVVLARARVGDTRAIVLSVTSNTAALIAMFRPMLTRDVTLCTDGSSAMRLAAQAVGVKHVALVTAPTSGSGIYRVQTVNSYQGWLKARIARFHGVATKYLDRYLTWHIMDERIQRLTAAKARAVLVGNTADLNPNRCCPNCAATLTAT
jgi:hypothetical protein